MPTPNNIIFFDGYCNLCNGFVDYLIRRDKKRKFKFASLQGETAANLLPDLDQSKFDTVIYYRDGKILERSTAVLYILHDLGGLWKIFNIYWIIPKFLRDAEYNFIAKRRFKWFGKRDTCRLPTEEERSYFLS